MKVRATETRTYEYEPDLEDDFYSERGAKTIEGALKADKEFFDKNGTKEMTTELDDQPTINVVWQLIGDDGSVIATF